LSTFFRDIQAGLPGHPAPPYLKFDSKEVCRVRILCFLMNRRAFQTFDVGWAGERADVKKTLDKK